MSKQSKKPGDTSRGVGVHIVFQIIDFRVDEGGEGADIGRDVSGVGAELFYALPVGQYRWGLWWVSENYVCVRGRGGRGIVSYGRNGLVVCVYGVFKFGNVEPLPHPEECSGYSAVGNVGFLLREIGEG